MRKIAVALLGLTLLLPLAACGKKPLTEAELRAMLAAEVTQEILAFEYDDYDGDGVFEAFAFVGEEQEPDVDESYMGEVWFVNANGAKKLEAYEHGYGGLINVCTFGKNKFAVLNQYATTGGCVSVWGVHKGKPRMESISGVGGGLDQIDDNNFTLWHSTYDFDVTDGISTGHTWKPYWFFWDGESFREHGGVPLAEEELRRLEGAAEVLEGIYGIVGDIFYRGTSGIVNINYTILQSEGGISNFYITLRLDGSKVTVLEEGEGNYQAALAPEIAVYPKEPVTFE